MVSSLKPSRALRLTQPETRKSPSMREKTR